MKSKGFVLALLFLGLSSASALADDVPPDCLQNFKVKEASVPATIEWILATGASAKMSCGAAELLRERLFVEGMYLLKPSDLNGAPAEAQRKALDAFDALEKKIKDLPGDDVPGTLF